MSSIDSLPKIGKGAVCNCDRAHALRTRVHSTSNTCESCRETARINQVLNSTPVLPPDKKRKTQGSSVSVQTHRPPSPRTMSHAPNERRRASRKSLKKQLRSSRNTTTIQLSKSSDDCGICGGKSDRRSWKNKLRGDTDRWVKCEMKTCGLWYHLSCVCVSFSKDPKNMVFCTASSPHRALLICPNCLDQPKKGYDKAVSQAAKIFMSTIEKLKGEQILEEESTIECTTQFKSDLEDNDDGGDSGTTEELAKNLGMGKDSVMEFDLVREEKYNGFDENTVNSLVRNLHQSIYDYDIEIASAIERFAPASDLRTQKPLGAWTLVDANDSVATGQQWFHTDDLRSKQPTCHAPITTALRNMLRTSDDKPLGIPPNLKNLAFSQVHIGLVSWFVFDVLDNGIDIYGLSNIKSMRAMMTAVTSAGEARWPKKGRHLLREVQLRTWYKSEFQQALLSNEEKFRQKLEAFIEPLTKDFDRIASWSPGRANIIEVTLRLWSYLQSLHGRLVMIQPAIGGPFDSKLHDAYDQDGLEQYPGKKSKKKILWVLCRGFQYEEDGVDEPRVLTVKARIII